MYSWKENFEDWRNDNRKRNIQNTDKFNFNCGGYALKTYNWYKPYDEYYDIDDIIINCIDGNYSEDEIEEEILEFMIENILHDFPNLIECSEAAATSNQTSIAFRFGLGDIDDIKDGFSLDWDFHFKLFEDGKWTEKDGGNSIHDCELNNKEPWISSNGRPYSSRIVYFIYKKEDEV